MIIDEGGAAKVGGAHAFVLFLARSVGLAPLYFEKVPPKTKRSRVSWFVNVSSKASIISCLAASVLTSFGLYGLSNELRTEPKLSIRMRSMTARVVGSCDVLAVVATSAAGVFGAPVRTRNTVKVLRLLSKVDQGLGLDMASASERNSILIIVTTLLLWTCLLLDDFSMYANQAKLINSHYKLLANYLPFYMLYYVIIMLEIQFAFTAHSIFLRLKKLNQSLAATGQSLVKGKDKNTRKITPIYNIKLGSNNINPGKLGAVVDTLGLVTETKLTSIDDFTERIRELSDLYGILCAAAREVDSNFGLPVLIILISTLLHLIVTPYFLILEIGGAQRLHLIVLQALWCLTHGIRLLMLVEPCHRTKAEAAKTSDILGEMLGIDCSNNATLRRLELFSRQLLHRYPNFTALGVCSLDRPLIASVTAAVTTYLVILIQFQKQDDLNSETKTG